MLCFAHRKKIICYIIILVGLPTVLSAQKKEVKEDSASYFKAGISFLSNAVYYGRKDSVNLAYTTPTIGYYHKSGVYATASASYLHSSTANRIDLFSIDAGYDATISDAFSASIYGSKYFYNTASTAVQSDASANLGANITYDPGLVALTGGVDLLFSSKTDIFINTGIAHNFYVGDSSSLWTFAPSAVVNFGSQNYYQGNKRNVRQRLATPPTITTYSKFLLLNYELSLPIFYDAKNYGFFLTPTYSIPQNPVTLTAANGNVISTEKITNLFYVEVGVYYKLHVKKK